MEQKLPRVGQKFKFANRVRHYVIIKVDQDSGYVFYTTTRYNDDTVSKVKISYFMSEKEKGNIEVLLG